MCCSGCLPTHPATCLLTPTPPHPHTHAPHTRYHPLQVDEVVDSIVATLAKFCAVLQPPKGAAAYGESAKAQGALEAMFAIANRWGEGWGGVGWGGVWRGVGVGVRGGGRMGGVGVTVVSRCVAGVGQLAGVGGVVCVHGCSEGAWGLGARLVRLATPCSCPDPCSDTPLAPRRTPQVWRLAAVWVAQRHGRRAAPAPPGPAARGGDCR